MLKKVSKNTVASQVINQLTDLIQSGRLQPGERLPSEREMAEQLGVSRPPIREALRVLEYAGVTETRYGDGIYVKSADFPLESKPLFSSLIDRYTLEDMIEMRKIVETAAIKLAVERASGDDVAVLETILERSRAGIDDLETFIESDFDFHAAIAEATGNDMLFTTVKTMRKLMNEFNSELLFNSRKNREQVLRQHEAILAQTKARNAKQAVTEMATHLGSVVDMAVDKTRSNGETVAKPSRRTRKQPSGDGNRKRA